MIRMQASGARQHLADTINRVAYRSERVVLERRGKALAVPVPVEDLARLDEIDNRQDVEAGAWTLHEMKQSGEKPIPWKKAKRCLGL